MWGWGWVGLCRGGVGLGYVGVGLYCIVLNYYTGTPLSPVDYFPGSPVKVTYTHTHTHNQEIS